MDDQMNQGMPGGAVPPPPPGGPMGGPAEDPHAKILSALERIEEKLVAIAIKVGA